MTVAEEVLGLMWVGQIWVCGECLTFVRGACTVNYKRSITYKEQVMKGWKWKVVNPERWESAKFCAFWMTLAAAIVCLGGLEWEPEMGDPMVPAPEFGVFFLITAGFIAWRMGSTTRR